MAAAQLKMSKYRTYGLSLEEERMCVPEAPGGYRVSFS